MAMDAGQLAAARSSRFAGDDISPVVVRRIGISDLRQALWKGADDFKAKPSHGVFLAAIFPFVGLFLFRLSFGYDVFPLLFPLMAGFALVGPFAAVGLYEISRRREAGLDTSWSHAFEVMQSHSRYAIAALGGILTVLFLTWLVSAWAIYGATFGGMVPVSLGDFARDVLTTPQGWALIVIGNGVGFLFALAALTISVVSFPLLLDRDVGLKTAVQTSIRVVQANPLAMAAWGIIVAATLVAGALTLFVGLVIAIPILGHATWHLYRKVIAQ